MKRRDFFKRVAPALAAPALFHGMRLRAIAGDDISTRSAVERLAMLADTDRVLVIVQLEGGNDGLNTVIPVEDPVYYTLRPNLAVSKDQGLALAGQDLLRLHPSMEGMRRMFDDGTMAIVENIGYERMNLSHFAGTEIWNTASGGAKVSLLDTGWVGRYLRSEFPDYPDTLPDDPPAIEISPATSSIFTVVGASIGMSLTDPEEFHELVGAGSHLDDEVDGTTPAGREWEFIDSIDRQSRTFAESVRNAYDRAQNLAGYPDTQFARSLAIIARLIAGGLRTRIYKVSLGNFDTHGYQETAHPLLLETLSSGIAAFQSDLASLGAADRVVGMTYSEFGRRVQENGPGTDHGTAAPHFVFGAQIRGGTVLGGIPDLANLDRFGNMPHAIDFHCYYASVIAPLFGLGPERVAEVLPFGACSIDSYLPLYHTSGAGSSGDPRSGVRITVAPNPARDVAYVRCVAEGREHAADLSVIDVLGRRVASSRLRTSGNAFPLDVSHLTAGTYVIAAQTRGGYGEARLTVVR